YSFGSCCRDVARNVSTARRIIRTGKDAARHVRTAPADGLHIANIVPQVAADHLHTAKDVPTVAGNDLHTAKDVPTVAGNDLHTANGIPTAAGDNLQGVTGITLPFRADSSGSRYSPVSRRDCKYVLLFANKCELGGG
ncbi:MAG: hypothetical protein LBS79_08820, partial [Tannerella sp.]|nr:hypothetical protein [Tannerella sp.]